MGAVNRPGRKPLRAGTRLVDALLDAGGFVQGASGEVVVARSGASFAGGARELRASGSAARTRAPTSSSAWGCRSRPGDRVTAALQR